ncbi:hypothetical protein [Spiroplasma endosymbiont of Labia minor]|uniref:hypothetical protein n=1 Tax=Spiroplasma endosymbiont of Labia minor TaxID=3066305 RepID=UPI0030D43BAB
MKNIVVNFYSTSDSGYDLSTLDNDIEYWTSNTEITEIEAKNRWFNLNETELKMINKNVNIDWFKTNDFIAGNTAHWVRSFFMIK